MTVVVSNKHKKKQVQAMLKKLETNAKRFDAKKYFGKAKVKGDPLQIQQQLRNE
jgi:hypothetical protein